MGQGRRDELLELAYAYVRDHGIAELSLRPLASAVGSSPRVLLFLFGSKDGLIRALLERARADELTLITRARAELAPPARDRPGEPASLGSEAGLDNAAEAVWEWLADDAHRPVLRLWAEAYARSLLETEGPWAGFARSTVDDWLGILATTQPAAVRDTAPGLAQRTAVLAVLRGALLDLLATGDRERTTAAVRHLLRAGPARAGHAPGDRPPEGRRPEGRPIPGDGGPSARP